jgi:hypothetical protein
MSLARRLAGVAGLLALAAIGVAALPDRAEAAWWHGGWCCSVGLGVLLPPVVVAPPVYAPPPVYYPPPAAYYPPPRPWIPPHWEGGYWVPGHWG